MQARKLKGIAAKENTAAQKEKKKEVALEKKRELAAAKLVSKTRIQENKDKRDKTKKEKEEKKTNNSKKPIKSLNKNKNCRKCDKIFSTETENMKFLWRSCEKSSKCPSWYCAECVKFYISSPTDELNCSGCRDD